MLRLLQINNGVFLKVNKPILEMLKLVNPYVTYGYPSLKTVRELMYKRGDGKVNKQRIPLAALRDPSGSPRSGRCRFRDGRL